MSTYVDNPTPIRSEIEIEPVLSFVSVAPVRQPIRLTTLGEDGEPVHNVHWLSPYESYGVVTRNEISRDYELYRTMQNRLAAGEVLTHDEALRADLAVDQILHLALPTITPVEWEGIATSDKQTLLAFFLEISNLTERAREDLRARMPLRSISQRSRQNSPGSTQAEQTRRRGGKSRQKSPAPTS